MGDFVRIKLAGRSFKEVEEICNQIREISKKQGTSIRGPVPLPTKRLKIPVLKTPCGDGTGHGNATWDRWQMRIHKRVIDVSDPRTLRHIIRLQIPENIKIDIKEMRD